MSFSILRNATPHQLELAIAANHQELFCMNTLARGGEVKTAGGITWTYEGEGKGSMIPFPQLTEENAGEKLDEMMAFFREHRTINAGCWSLWPTPLASLGARLLARGFQPGWLPNWMALDLQKIKTGHSLPADIIIQADNDTDTGPIKDLPYAGENGAVSNALMRLEPERTKRYVALLDGKIVGHSCVFLSTGEDSVAGIYNVGVLPRMRNRGIAKAVVTACCLYAREKGYGYATLNGTGRRMYEQVGFEHINDGITWWLMSDRYISHPPTSQQVALAEAIATGDIALLDRLAPHFTTDDLASTITNGMTLMQLAAYCKQRVSVEWLTDHRVPATVLAYWDLGWRDRAANLLIQQPALVNYQYGEGQTTILHTAAERNDIRLAKLALSANPDLEIKDKTYDATALGWAIHLSRKQIEMLIRAKS